MVPKVAVGQGALRPTGSLKDQLGFVCGEKFPRDPGRGGAGGGDGPIVKGTMV